MHLRFSDTPNVLQIGKDTSNVCLRVALPAQDIAGAEIPIQHSDGVQDEERCSSGQYEALQVSDRTHHMRHP